MISTGIEIRFEHFFCMEEGRMRDGSICAHEDMHVMSYD